MFDILVATPFRHPTLRRAIIPDYPEVEPWDSPSLVLAGALEEVGLSVVYLPLQNFFPAFNGAKDGELLSHLVEKHPARVLMFASDHFIPSRSTSTLFGVREIGERFRARYPQALIGLSGRLATVLQGSIFDRVKNLDFIMLGESEQTVGTAVLDLLSKGLSAASSHHSVITRDEYEGRVLERKFPAFTAQLDDSPIPAFHLAKRAIDLFHHYSEIKGLIPFSLRTSSGCVYQCRFCAGVPSWRRYRTKSANRLAVELKCFQAQLGDVAYIGFLEDEIFSLRLDHVIAAAQAFEEAGVRVGGLYTHAKLVSEEKLQHIRRVSRSIRFGLDSADDKILTELDKNQTVVDVINACHLARQCGLQTHLEFVVGFPSQTEASLNDQLRLLFRLLHENVIDDAETYVFCPHPGTEYGAHASTYGIEFLDDWEYMNESGGYPVYKTWSLERDTIFRYYLMSRTIISEMRVSKLSQRLYESTK